MYSKLQACRPEECYLYPQFTHSSFSFTRNPDKVGHLNSPFFTHVIQTYVPRGRNSLTCKANFTIFFVVFIKACYIFRLFGPSSGIEIHDYTTQNDACARACVCMYVCIYIYIYTHTQYIYIYICSLFFFYFESQYHIFYCLSTICITETCSFHR